MTKALHWYFIGGMLVAFAVLASANATAPIKPPVAPATANAALGGISGSIGYPSDAIPAMTIVAYQSTDYKKLYKVETSQNQATFTINSLPPGTYVLVGYATDSSMVGGYTKAVPCGLEVTCTDHSLIPVKVEAGKVSSGVEVKDFYAPDKTFPPKPKISI